MVRSRRRGWCPGIGAAFLHELPADSVHTLADDRAAAVRVDIVTPPGVLNRERQRQLVRQATDAVADAAADPAVAGRTWVVLRESAEGGWGIAGTAFGREEFASLRRRFSERAGIRTAAIGR